jgi:predicted metalloprotease with PDZ domain
MTVKFWNHLRGFACAACLLLLISVAVSAQERLRIKYWLAMPHPTSHLFEVTIEVELPADSSLTSLDFQMPKWSPGRYAVFDFAKNVQEVRYGLISPSCSGCPAANKPIPALPAERIDDQTWRVQASQRIITFNYKVFANDLSGTFSQLDSRHANFNGGCLFMYVVNHKQDPVALSINPPKSWRVVNGRTEKKDQTEFQFPNWDIMTDTPTEISPDWTDDSFTIDGKTYHVVIHSSGREGGKRPALVRDLEKIVRTETAMWGAPEFESYTFLIHFANDGHSSDGMEHLTSTQIIQPGALGEGNTYEETLDTAAHEFFHVWNVKRLRPAELGPWDFTRPANTRGLWIAEGITNYYGHLMQRRAGIWNDAKLFAALGEQIADIENSPGGKLMSAEESSLVAPFIDDATHAQQTNLGNTAISYYPKGETIGVVLDLLIRGKTGGRASLDDVMRRMYGEFYLKSPNASYYLRGRGYEPEDFQRVTSDVAGEDMGGFFKRYVGGAETLPYNQAFAQVGLRLVREPRAPVTVGITADDQEKTSFRIAEVRPDSPASRAGLQQNDVISMFGGVKLTPTNLTRTVSRYKPGDRVALVVQRGDKTLNMTVTMDEPVLFNYRIEEDGNASVEAKMLRTKWLNGK